MAACYARGTAGIPFFWQKRVCSEWRRAPLHRFVEIHDRDAIFFVAHLGHHGVVDRVALLFPSEIRCWARFRKSSSSDQSDHPQPCTSTVACMRLCMACSLLLPFRRPPDMPNCSAHTSALSYNTYRHWHCCDAVRCWYLYTNNGLYISAQRGRALR